MRAARVMAQHQHPGTRRPGSSGTRTGGHFERGAPVAPELRLSGHPPARPACARRCARPGGPTRKRPSTATIGIAAHPGCRSPQAAKAHAPPTDPRRVAADQTASTQPALPYARVAAPMRPPWQPPRPAAAGRYRQDHPESTRAEHQPFLPARYAGVDPIWMQGSGIRYHIEKGW